MATATTPAVAASRALDLQIDIDHTALETFECPTFDEATAVGLDELEEAHTIRHQSAATAPLTMIARTNGLETSFQSLLRSDVALYIPPLQLEGEEVGVGREGERGFVDGSDPPSRCTYRKGRCSELRTLKKNGDLHSFCEYHRSRSILNQKNFDKKRRAKTHEGVGRPRRRDRKELDHSRAAVRSAARAASTHDPQCMMRSTCESQIVTL